MDIYMDLAGICAVADAMESLSWALATMAGRSLDASTEVARAHAGWDSSGTVQACQQVWSKHLSDLFGAVSATAQKLHGSASTIQQADEEAARRLYSVFSGLSY